jgi:hypothetical protein
VPAATEAAGDTAATGAPKVRLPRARTEPAAAARSALGAIRAADTAVAPRVELNPGASESAEPISLVWNVPYARNLQFTGRSEVIVRLETELNSGPAAAVTQAIAGLGGIGKTQLALEYCYRNREKYKVIWWIRAESKETRITDFVALGQRIGVIDIESSDDSASIRPIIEWLDRNFGWLLIFDNVEDPSDLDSLLPTAGRGHILITSRRAAWGSRANAVALDVWTADEASRYLLKRTGQADTEVNRASATALAATLGYLPLAIEQAAAYIDESRIGIVGYAELFEKQQLRLLRRRPSHPNSDAKTIATVWEISLRSVEQKSPGAVALLTLCAFMRPDQISKDDIKNHSQVMPEPLRTTASNTMVLHDAIAVLRAYSLIEATDQFVSIHRLVQLVVRDRLNASDYRQFHELADRLEHGVADSQYPDEQSARTLWDTSVGIWDDLTGKVRTRRNFLIFAGTAVTVGGIGFALYKRPEDATLADLEDASPEDKELSPPGGVTSAEAFSLSWLPEVLKSAGLKVAEQPGWRNRGRGDVGTIKGVMCHHTAGSANGNMPSLNIITNGRADLPGPYGQLALGRDGTFFVVAAGLAYHAGQGVWQGITTGNASFIGIQAENSGLPDDPWPRVQLLAYMQGVAAILKKIGADTIMCCGHKEYSLPRGRKNDPSFDMDDFRAQVALIMAGKAPVPM